MPAAAGESQAGAGLPSGAEHGKKSAHERAAGSGQDHARLRGAAVRRGARARAHARGAGELGERAARRARALPHLRARDQHRRGARHPAPSGPSGHGATEPALGLRPGREPVGGMAARSEVRLPVLTGRAWAFADDLAAADILPARFALLPAAEAARRLFADLDATLAAQLCAGDVLVAGQQLGAGPGGGEAARALAAAGVIAVVAGSFAPGFAEAVLAAGLPPLEVDAPAVFHTGQRMRLNLEAGAVPDPSSGDPPPPRQLH